MNWICGTSVLPGRAPLCVPSVQVLPIRAPRSVQTHPRMPIVVDHLSALILALKQTARSHLMRDQRGWIKVRTQFRPRVRTYLRTFFKLWEKSEKPLYQRDQENMKKTLRNPGLGENLEGRHQARESQRSAPQSAQKCVLQKKALMLNSVLGGKP